MSTGTTEIRPLIRYAAPAFSYDRSEQLSLRIQVGADELVFSVFDPLPASFVLIEKFAVQKGYAGLKAHQAIARILHTHPSVRSLWKTVEWISMSPIYTLIPATLNEETNPKDAIDLVHKPEPDRHYGSVLLPAFEVSLIYAWDIEMKETLSQYFPTALSSHYMKYLLGNLSNGQNPETFVLAHVNGYHLDVVVIKDSKLLFCNLFHFQSPDDFIYFLLIVCEQLNLDRETIPLQLAGEIESGSALYQACFKYFRILGFMNRFPAYPVPAPDKETDPLASYAYFTLLHPDLENY